MNTGHTNGSGPLVCIKCGGSMSRIVLKDVEADRCKACGGLWLDALELQRVVKDRRSVRGLEGAGEFTPGPAAGNKPLLCPRDHSTLIVMGDPNQPHVRFEACTVCGGVFLDRGELKDLASFTLLERLYHQLGRSKR